jgi:hypothetical protein
MTDAIFTFPPKVITVLAIACIATTFVVVIPWYVYVNRHSKRSIAFMVTALCMACAKLMVMVPILMLWAVGQFKSSTELWAISLPFLLDFLLLCRAARFFRPEQAEPRKQ